MPRFARVIAACSALLFAPALAGAQTGAHFSVAAGASFPTGNFDDFSEIGYHVLAGLELHPPSSPLGFRIDGMFNEFDNSGLGSASTRILALTGNAVVRGSAFGPYLIGGIGLYGTKASSGGASDSDVGFNVGGGFRFGLTGFTAFAEARYHRVREGLSFIPVTFGVTF